MSQQELFNPLSILTVPIGIVQTQYVLGRVSVDGKEYVAIKFDDPTGCKVVLFEPPKAKELADRLRATALGLALVTNNPAS